MDMPKLLTIFRRYLTDTGALVWTDAELIEILNQAARDYSADSKAFHGEFMLFPDPDGSYRYPSDFIAFQAGWNEHSRQIRPESSVSLEMLDPAFSAVRGSAEFIYDDMSGPGRFRLYPNPAEQQNVTEIPCDLYGVCTVGGYGFDDGDNDNYGVVLEAFSYISAGSITYCAAAAPEKVKDHIGVIFRGLSAAFAGDSDFCDPGKSAFYERAYHARIARFMQTRHKNSGRSTPNQYF